MLLAFTSIAENYQALKETWLQAKEVSRDSEARARIGGVAKKWNHLTFYSVYI